MPRKPLKNKPLIEAIFEFRWGVHEPPLKMKPHPRHKIPISKMYGKIKDGCPLYEQLPTVTMPGETTGG